MMDTSLRLHTPTKGIGADVERQLLERALITRPADFELMRRLIEVYCQLECRTAAAELIERFQRHEQFGEEGQLLVASFWFLLRETSRVIRVLADSGIDLSSNDTAALLYAKACLAEGEHDRCRVALERVLSVQPDNEAALSQQLQLLELTADIATTIELAERILAKNPRNVFAKAVLNDAQWTPRTLQSPPLNEEFSSRIRVYSVGELIDTNVDGMNRALNASIEERTGWITNPKRYSTRSGRQLLGVFGRATKNSDAYSHLKTAIACGLKDYLASSPACDEEYFKVSASDFDMDAWAVALEAGGRQGEHLHPGGWISGVYYTHIESAWGEGEGALEMGVVDEGKKFRTLHTIHPVSGKMVLFPSYYRHRTVPFATGTIRISFAFDVTPRST
jgi:tetratricopeptide (TPR) repeat protein